MTRIKILQDILKTMGLKWGLVVAMLAIGVLFVTLEAASFVMLYPTLLYVESGPDALISDTSIVSRGVVSLFNFVGAPISLMSLLGIGLVLQIARQILSYGKTLIGQYGTHHARRNLQMRGMGAYLDADVSFFFRHNRAEILATISTFPSQAAPLVVHLFELVTSTALILTYIVCLATISPWLALMAAVAALPTIWFIRSVVRRGNVIASELSDETLALGNRLYEDIQGIRLIKMRGAEERSLERFAALFGRLVQLNLQLDRARLSIEAYSHPILMILTVITFYLAVTQLGLGLASLGVFVLIVMRMTPYFGQINVMRLEINNALEKFMRYQKMLDTALDETTLQDGEVEFSKLSDCVHFKNISFAYTVENGKTQALSNVDFKVPHGQIVALVGRSGAGKSSLADMIPRFLEPDEGEVIFDGISAVEYELKSLRRGIAIVPQDSIFFDDTIRNNIIYGLQYPPNDEELIRILEESHCLGFVNELPSGMDTMIGDRGVRLSGGQRQRLSFARALAVRPQILVLDEPTSALDSESEAAIQASLQKLRGRITVIVIAHRLATIRHADAIAVLEKGGLVGYGSHDDLLEKSEIYQRLFAMQMSF